MIAQEAAGGEMGADIKSLVVSANTNGGGVNTVAHCLNQVDEAIRRVKRDDMSCGVERMGERSHNTSGRLRRRERGGKHSEAVRRCAEGRVVKRSGDKSR